jgi:hypothetical protein
LESVLHTIKLNVRQIIETLKIAELVSALVINVLAECGHRGIGNLDATATMLQILAALPILAKLDETNKSIAISYIERTLIPIVMMTTFLKMTIVCPNDNDADRFASMNDDVKTRIAREIVDLIILLLNFEHYKLDDDAKKIVSFHTDLVSRGHEETAIFVLFVRDFNDLLEQSNQFLLLAEEKDGDDDEEESEGDDEGGDEGDDDEEDLEVEDGLNKASGGANKGKGRAVESRSSIVKRDLISSAASAGGGGDGSGSSSMLGSSSSSSSLAIIEIEGKLKARTTKISTKQKQPQPTHEEIEAELKANQDAKDALDSAAVREANDKGFYVGRDILYDGNCGVIILIESLFRVNDYSTSLDVMFYKKGGDGFKPGRESTLWLDKVQLAPSKQ